MVSQKTLLITGGTGYIGSHAVVAFEQAGYKTVILDNLVNSSRETLYGIEKILGYCPDFYECDIRDRLGLEKIFQQYTFDGVIHFAGLKAVGESCQKVGYYHENNVTGSIALFDVMEKYAVKNIVFSSSATVYKSDNISPYTEDMPTGTTNPYGTTKLVIEKLIEDYSVHADWSAVSLRYFNPTGAHPSGYIGEFPIGIPNNLLPYIFDVACGKREYVSIFGDDYDTPDGTGMRDYIDINDLIEAHILAYTKMEKGYVVFNVGTGIVTSVKEMIHTVSLISDKNIPYRIAPRRLGDLPLYYADATKIEKRFGWRASRTLTVSILSGWNFIKRRVE